MRWLAALFVILVTVIGAPAWGAPGDLDTNFGSSGFVTTNFGDVWSEALVRQPDGKFVTAVHIFYSDSIRDGVFAVARHNSDGTLDTSFGTDGLVRTEFTDWAWPSSIVMQPDAKLVVAGECAGDFALARYNPDGTLDASFGTTGLVTTDFGAGDKAFGIVVQPDGKLVAAGCGCCDCISDIALARYNSDGTLDTSFGTGGLVTTDLGGDERAFALAEQGDGKLVVAGRYESSGHGQFVLARYNPDGSLDASFGTGGLVTTDLGSTFAVAQALVIQLDGKLVAAGWRWDDMALARFNPDGSLDASFGVGGFATAGFDGRWDEATAVVVQEDGRLVAVGGSRAGGYYDYDLALSRYNPDGTLDTTFGAAGLVRTRFPGSGKITMGLPSGVLLEPDGGLVVGVTRIRKLGAFDNDGNLALVRYFGGSVLQCAATPLTGCKTPAVSFAASLLIRDNTQDRGDRLAWKWVKGQETLVSDFGDPVTIDDYAFCLYDESTGSSRLLFSATAPAGGLCPSRPCWLVAGAGFKYADGARTPQGIRTVLLRPGSSGSARVTVKGKGENLPMPTLPLSMPLRVQLQASNGNCWEATYDSAGVKTNEADRFKATAGSPNGAFLGVTSALID